MRGIDHPTEEDQNERATNATNIEMQVETRNIDSSILITISVIKDWPALTMMLLLHS